MLTRVVFEAAYPSPVRVAFPVEYGISLATLTLIRWI